MFTEEDYNLIEKEFAPLREAARKRCADREQFELVLKAFDFANEAHKNVRRRSGEPYILHPIAVAKIVVSEIGLGCKSICAALLHDVVEDTEFTTADIEHLFGEKIASLVDGLTKIKVALSDSKDATSLQAENFKRILLTLNDDVRIVLIKLADRLHNVRTIQYMPEYKREKILSETMYIFIPLAHKLGLYSMKSEMENIWLQYHEPQAYAEIRARLDAFEKERSVALDEFIAPISERMEQEGFKFTILKRLKSPYSIWKKMTIKNVPFDEIYDIYATRIIFEPKEGFSERDQCWFIFAMVTGLYSYKTDRVRDWLKEPKSNGYEALHVTAMSAAGFWVEVQIRSERMNSIAERGLAAHWLYKRNAEGQASESEVDLWLKKVRDIIENPDANAIQFLDEVHKELVTGDIYVFTHKGEPRNLPKGYTALDFAYAIHTDIGNRAIAAKINQKLEPLSTELQNGDQVEIITAEKGKPQREWLTFLQSSRAKSKVLDAIRGEIKDAVHTGFQILEAELTKRGVTERIKVIKQLQSYYTIANKEDLYNRIGIGVIDLSDLDQALQSEQEAAQPKSTWKNILFHIGKKETPKEKKKEIILTNEDISDSSHFHLAKCCCPIPGDNVVGFQNPDGSVTIHKKSCSQVTDMASKEGEKIIAITWDKHSDTSFLTGISIKGLDRVGLLEDMTREISSGLGINMKKLNLETRDGIFYGYIELLVHHSDDLDSLICRLKKLKDVKQVSRKNINRQ